MSRGGAPGGGWEGDLAVENSLMNMMTVRWCLARLILLPLHLFSMWRSTGSSVSPGILIAMPWKHSDPWIRRAD